MFKFYLLVSYYLSFFLMAVSLFSGLKGLDFYFFCKSVMLEWEIFECLGSSSVMVILLDWLSLTFISFVSFISSVVLLYSSFYMSAESYAFKRFIFLVYLFVISMGFLILSPNMMSILIGWDGLGLVSYCLVIYYQNVKSANAGMLTILSNRVGDVAILLSIAWLSNFGSWNFFYLEYMFSKNDLIIVLFFTVLAGMTKSAQIPFSAWLPAAMAAPTPVSALVHSSTLVTAGVYLMIRFSFLLGDSLILFYFGVFTMFMSGLGANYETDLKKVIALSTLSQLGVMMMIVSLGSVEMTFFHLLSHALFKSLLFLCAGVFIHSMLDSQDVRLLGGLSKSFPLSSLFFTGCSLSLCGFVFLSGFYSKDLILEYYFMGEMNFFMLLVILLGTFFTVSYSLRLGFFLYLKNLGVHSLLNSEEELGMLKPMMLLFLVSVVGGSFMSWIYFPEESVILPKFWKTLILVGVFLVSYLTYLFVSSNDMIFINFLRYQIFVAMMWLMPFLSTNLLMPFLKFGSHLVNYFDRGWIEYFSGQGLNKLSSIRGSQMDFISSLSLKTFIFIFFLMSIIFVSLN